MAVKRFWAALMATAALASPAGAADSAPGVKTPSGTYAGTTTVTGRRFMGIPYAVPPVGPLRWQPPRAVADVTATVDATKAGDMCVQPKDGSRFVPTAADPFVGFEDCLSLNVYTPVVGQAKKPVMVWIHGGGYMSGAGSTTDAHVLAERNDMVVVTLNYRLGNLGFYAAPGLGDGSGNFGILDQQLALKWVQRNIGAFGGDAANVTIFGESAGGNSVCMQLLSPGSKGLYNKAILESAACGPGMKIYPRAEAEQAGALSAKTAGCVGSEMLACMRGLPPYRVSALHSTLKSLGMIPWAPIAGTPVIPLDAQAFVNGRFNRVPTINGTNLDEGRTFALFAQNLGQINNVRDYENTMRTMFEDRADKVLRQYPATAYPSALLAYSAVMTDATFACPARSFQTTASKYVPVYAYEFRDVNAPIEAKPTAEMPSYGAFHAAEMQYIFQTDMGFTNPARFTPAQWALARRMTQAWVTFARSGTPRIDGEAAWRSATPTNTNLRVFDTSIKPEAAGFAAVHQCAFWAAL